MITAAQIHELPGEVLHYVKGPLTNKVSRLLPPEHAQPESIVFASQQGQLEQALANKTSIIVAAKNLHLPDEIGKSCLFTTAHVTLAIASVAPFFDKKIQRFQQPEHIHPKSSVHPNAKLGKNVIVAPGAIIGAEAQIGDHSIIGANAVIESHARIGANSLIHPLVFIGAYCEIGSHCEIHPHTTIGADGFGFVPLKGSHPVKIPQLGKVVIGDHVEIGANCTIDRATMTETRIGSGGKLDNLCHIGHNSVIGENLIAAAGFMTAGSVNIGKNFMAGGCIIVTDHVQIVDNVAVSGRSAVTKDITQAGQYGGYPLQPLKDSLKNVATFAHLTEMRRQLQRIAKHLGLE